MTIPKIIALYSPAPQSGKSTVAEILATEFGYVRFSFARPLKQMLRALLLSARLPQSEIEERLFGSMKETPIPQLGNVTARHLAQTLGTEWGRQCIYPDLWVDTMTARLQAHLAEGGLAVIDDMRFDNERMCVSHLGGFNVLVSRPSVAHSTTHASEGGLDWVTNKGMWDDEIVNDGTLDELHAAVRRMVEGRMLRRGPGFR